MDLSLDVIIGRWWGLDGGSSLPGIIGEDVFYPLPHALTLCFLAAMN
jgi:hypothetical protein